MKSYNILISLSIIVLFLYYVLTDSPIKSNINSIKNDSFYGLVINKTQKSIARKSQKIVLNGGFEFNSVFHSGLYDFIKIGDSIYKKKDETKIIVIQNGIKYIFYSNYEKSN
jgi:hypothetical protein